MKIKKILCTLSAIAMAAACFTGCDDKEESSTEKAVVSESSVAETQAEETKGTAGTVRFMADFDLNPSYGQEKSIALTLFEQVYGGYIEWVPTTQDTMYDDLAKSVQGGDPVDMFPYCDNAVPYGVSQGLFDPLDDRIDLSSEKWAASKTLADKMAYGGKHYVIPTGISDTTVLVYSKSVVEDQGLDDPYTLYKDGKWTWDAFTSMMKEFSETGCAGAIGKGLMQSTGQPYVNYDGSAFSSNLDNETLAAAGEVQENVSGMYTGEWYDRLDDSILFLGIGSWAIPQSNDYNDDQDIFFVPFPSQDGSGKNITAQINSKMLVKGAKNPAGVAAYLDCERIASTEEKYVKAQRDAAVKSGFTEEQYDFLTEINKLDNVVFDFSYGLGKSVSHDASAYDERGAVNNLNDALLFGYSDAPSDWKGLKDSVKETFEKEIGTY